MAPKKCMDIPAAEFASTDSLSFASLICNQDQQHSSIPPPPSNTTATRKEDFDSFEFSTSINSGSSTVDPPAKNKGQTKANDQLHTTSQLPQVLEQYSNNSKVWSRSSSKRANDECAKKTNGQERKKSDKQGAKWFDSFMPCRNCRAVEPAPSMKQQPLRY